MPSARGRRALDVQLGTRAQARGVSCNRHGSVGERLVLKERGYRPADGKILSATSTEQAGHWSVSVQVEQEHVVPANRGPAVGVDLGMKCLATLSDGAEEPNPRHLQQRLRKIKRC